MTKVTDVIVDLDGVIYPFTKAFRAVHSMYCSQKKLADLSPIREWDFYKNWGMTTPQFIEALKDYSKNDSLFDRCDPEPNTFRGWTLLKLAEVHIHIVTARPSEARKQTIDWLDGNNLLADSLHFTHNKGLHFGPDTCTMGIDDHVEHFLDMRQAGIDAYLMTQPWNEYADTPQRFDSFYSFALKVYDINTGEY